MENKEYHNTFWQQNNIVPTHRYYVLFSAYDKMPKSKSITGFDNYDDALEEVKLLNEVYRNISKPSKLYNDKGQFRDKLYGKYDWDFSDGSYFWGYALLDMEKCKFLKIVNEFHNPYMSISNQKKMQLDAYDYYFRKDSEVPKDYEWHCNGAEYKGWLQFRWGDGKNAINYVEPPKKERPGVDEIWEVYDEATDTYKKQKVRVVYVDWNDPLPKKENGIKYLRPNKEPILFPGDYGYEDDLNINEWSLTEEIVEDEYLDKIGQKNFTVEKPTTASLAEILGDKNPLLKLLKK